QKSFAPTSALPACLATRPCCRRHEFQVRLSFIDDSAPQVGFGTIALVVHSNAAGRPLRERQIVQTLAAFLVVQIVPVLEQPRIEHLGYSADVARAVAVEI